MPTNINDKLISWASEIDQETIRQAEKTARLPIIEGHVALMPDAHVGIGCDRRLGDPDDRSGDPGRRWASTSAAA